MVFTLSPNHERRLPVLGHIGRRVANAVNRGTGSTAGNLRFFPRPLVARDRTTTFTGQQRNRNHPERTAPEEFSSFLADVNSQHDRNVILAFGRHGAVSLVGALHRMFARVGQRD